MNPTRRRGTKKKTEATLPRCPQVRDPRSSRADQCYKS